MKTGLIVNRRSGSWARWEAKLTQYAGQSGTRLLCESGHDSIRDVLADARRQRLDRVLVAGGDGSLSRITNAGLDLLPELEFAVLPTGTGNDLARSIGVQGEPWDDIWQWAVSAPATPIDLIKATNGQTYYLVNAATAGFGGTVSTDVTSDDKRRWGAVAYWMTAFSHLAALEEFDVQLELDSETLSVKTFGLAIANGRFVGGGFPVAPAAMVDDGLLDLTTVPVLPVLELIAAGVDFTLGRHHQNERVRSYRSSHVRVHAAPVLPYSLDGEPTRSIDATFDVVPSVLRIVCGPQANAVRHKSCSLRQASWLMADTE